MSDLVLIAVERSIISTTEEGWSCHGPLPENWDTMTNNERFAWAEENVDDVYVRNEWPEGTEEISSIEFEEW